MNTGALVDDWIEAVRLTYKPKHKHVHEWTYFRTIGGWTLVSCRCGAEETVV